MALPPPENLIGLGIKFGGIRDDNLLRCRKHENIPDHVDSYHAQEKGSTASSTYAETVPDQHIVTRFAIRFGTWYEFGYAVRHS
jgi:hypothetical protein